MTYLNPQYFWLLLLLIPLAVWLVMRPKHNDASLQVSSTKAFEGMAKTKKIWLYYFPSTLIVVALLVIVLARPQTSDSYSNSTTEGINIVIAMDISGSMLARDLSPNRLEAERQFRTCGLCRWEFHAMPYYKQPCLVGKSLQTGRFRYHTRRYCYRSGFGYCHKPHQGRRRQVESDNTAHRRYQQHRRHCSHIGGTDSTELWYKSLYDRCRYAGYSRSAYARPVR